MDFCLHEQKKVFHLSERFYEKEEKKKEKKAWEKINKKDTKE